VFISPPSASAPAKLRLLYECYPLAYIIEVRPKPDRLWACVADRAVGLPTCDGAASLQLAASRCATP
jgi:hypothetical protein